MRGICIVMGYCNWILYLYVDSCKSLIVLLRIGILYYVYVSDDMPLCLADLR